MTHKVLELKPNREFVDPQFNGYKLSLDAIPIFKKDLDKPVDRILLSSSQYSYLHVRLNGLHNHLIGETIDEMDILYAIDDSWCIKRIDIDDVSGTEVSIMDVISIPKCENLLGGKYNVSLKLASDSIAIFCNGMGKLFLLQTGDRRYNKTWHSILTEDILNDSNSAFIIEDARFHVLNGENEIHCLLHHINQNADEKESSNVLYWAIFKETNGKWRKHEVKKIIGNGVLYYAYLETSCEAVYIISEGCFQFVESFPGSEMIHLKKKYCWSQTEEDLAIVLKLPDNISMDCIFVNSTSTDILVKINNKIVVNSKLCYKIDDYLTNWSIENGLLEVKLIKQEEGQLWPCLIPGDNSGEYIVNSTSVTEIHNKLAQVYNENQIITPLGTSFNSEQVEECDFEQDKYTTFERISRITHETTHKVNINTHTLLLTVQKEAYLPSAVALRHDVDAYIWQPTFRDDNFCFIHEGTLNAFGYVQASKQQRKFSVCAPNLSYCAICETSRHLFIYRQKKTVSGGELRHRTSGKRIGHIAEQQVVNLPDDEILGIYASVSKLFLLTLRSIYVLVL